MRSAAAVALIACRWCINITHWVDSARLAPSACVAAVKQQKSRAPPYLHQVDERREDGTSKHIVLFGLLPEQRQVLHQTAYVWTDLKNKKQKHIQTRIYRHS